MIEIMCRVLRLAGRIRTFVGSSAQASTQWSRRDWRLSGRQLSLRLLRLGAVSVGSDVPGSAPAPRFGRPVVRQTASGV